VLVFKERITVTVHQRPERKMETLLITYAIAWAMVSAYAAWLAIVHRRLFRRFERLEMLVGKEQDSIGPITRVA